MKKVFLTSLLAVFAATSANAAMVFNPYVGVRGGYDIRTNVTTDAPINNPDDSYADGWLVGGTIGTTFFDSDDFAARIEAEYIYTSIGEVYKTADVANHTALLNLVGDIKTGLSVTPYITAGIGYSWTFLSTNGTDTDDSNLAWQVGAGLTYEITDSFNVDLGYRYLNNTTFTTPESDGSIEFEVESHQVYLGLRYAF